MHKLLKNFIVLVLTGWMSSTLFDLDPLFVNEKELDFRLKEDSPAFKIGFQKIPYEKIGLSNKAGSALPFE